MPNEVYSGNVQFTLNGIKSKVVVNNSPRFVVLEVIHDDSVSVDIENVSEWFVALSWRHVDKLKSLSRIALINGT